MGLRDLLRHHQCVSLNSPLEAELWVQMVASE